MENEVAIIIKELEQLQQNAIAFFDSTELVFMEARRHARDNDTDYANDAWHALEDAEREQSSNLQNRSLRCVGAVATLCKSAPLVSAADEQDLKLIANRMRSALRFRRYIYLDSEVVHDDGTVYGFKPATQEELMRELPSSAKKDYINAADMLRKILDLIDAAPVARGSEPGTALSTEIAKYRRNTAFVIMQINADDGSLEDRYNAIKECCRKFGINAVRADEIEHEEVITERILSEIKSAEFLIADLGGERPSVYYEIGYAHALGRRVIMYRPQGTKIHFDLAAYNCPEYKNNTDLLAKLTSRLEQHTNRKPKNV